MSSRPKHVSALSEKISGLKFMQRAKAVQEQALTAGQSRNGESSSRVVPASSAEGTGDGIVKSPSTNGTEDADDGNDEHWVLAAAANTTPSLKRKASESTVIIHEPGWNAWLIDAEDDTAWAGKIEGRSNTRRVFGSWATKRAKKQKDSSTKDDAKAESKRGGGKNNPDQSAGSDASDDSSDDAEAMKDLESSGFVKPGSLSTTKGGKGKSKSPSSARAGSESGQSSSVRGADSESAKKSKGGQGRKEKKRNNTNGRPLLSGFSNFIQSDKKKQK